MHTHIFIIFFIISSLSFDPNTSLIYSHDRSHHHFASSNTFVKNMTHQPLSIPLVFRHNTYHWKDIGQRQRSLCHWTIRYLKDLASPKSGGENMENQFSMYFYVSDVDLAHKIHTESQSSKHLLYLYFRNPEVAVILKRRDHFNFNGLSYNLLVTQWPTATQNTTLRVSRHHLDVYLLTCIHLAQSASLSRYHEAWLLVGLEQFNISTPEFACESIPNGRSHGNPCTPGQCQ
jgi:hypothetical protein